MTITTNGNRYSNWAPHSHSFLCSLETNCNLQDVDELKKVTQSKLHGHYALTKDAQCAFDEMT